MSYDDWHALEVEGWTTNLAPPVDQPEDGSYVLYQATPPKELPICRKCGLKFGLHDSRPRRYRDLPRDGRHALLSVQRRRLKCRCGISTERLDALDEKHTATRALVAQLERASLERRTFSELARLYGIEHKTIRDINRNYVARRDADREKRHALLIPQHLGIHPMKLSRRECCLLTNVERRTVFEVTSNQSVETIKERFQKLFDPSDLENVFMVSIPPNEPYRRLVKSLFPKARILVPTGYLAALASGVMESAVVEMKSAFGGHIKTFRTLKRLSSAAGSSLSPREAEWLRKELMHHEQLQASYDHKEWFLKILTIRDKTKALSEYKQWYGNTPTELERIFSPIISLVSGWKTYVFPSSDIYYSKYLEELEKLIKELLIEGRAYSFEVIRGRLLYSPDFQAKLQRPSTRASCDLMIPGARRVGLLMPEDIRDELGASIESITKALQQHSRPRVRRKKPSSSSTL